MRVFARGGGHSGKQMVEEGVEIENEEEGGEGTSLSEAPGSEVCVGSAAIDDGAVLRAGV